MRQTVPAVAQGSAMTPHPQLSLPGTLQIPPADPTDGAKDAGHPSMQVEPVPQAEPGMQLANERLLLLPESLALSPRDPASGIGRQAQARGTTSYPGAQSTKHWPHEELAARTTTNATMSSLMKGSLPSIQPGYPFTLGQTVLTLTSSSDSTHRIEPRPHTHGAIIRHRQLGVFLTYDHRKVA